VFTDRLIEWQCDRSDFIICPMLCYSNGTDKNVQLFARKSYASLYVIIIKKIFSNVQGNYRNSSNIICVHGHALQHYKFILRQILSTKFSNVARQGVEHEQAQWTDRCRTTIEAARVQELWKFSQSWRLVDMARVLGHQHSRDVIMTSFVSPFVQPPPFGLYMDS